MKARLCERGHVNCEVDHVGVHASHCCRKHGCKYGNDDCPVVAGTVEQEHGCEDGHEDNPCRGMSRLDKVTAERDAWKALAKARLAYMIASADGNLAACYAADAAASKAMLTLRALGVPEEDLA